MLRIDLVQAGSSCGSEKNRASHQWWPLVFLSRVQEWTGPENPAWSPPCTEMDVEYPNDLESIPVLHGLHILLVHRWFSDFYFWTLMPRDTNTNKTVERLIPPDATPSLLHFNVFFMCLFTRLDKPK
ncbi:hypothetical protein FQA47_015655 [Oryzias melastigma]|uniref:Uncharacterized protein n=1 Tax=Oryzias melastigma TaxID=30732 RepID=A0A834F9V2_ORYME|nr:hypothetical protein FQA47_015655 [Oryzias melastigma]